VQYSSDAAFATFTESLQFSATIFVHNGKTLRKTAELIVKKVDGKNSETVLGKVQLNLHDLQEGGSPSRIRLNVDKGSSSSSNSGIALDVVVSMVAGGDGDDSSSVSDSGSYQQDVLSDPSLADDMSGMLSPNIAVKRSVSSSSTLSRAGSVSGLMSPTTPTSGASSSPPPSAQEGDVVSPASGSPRASQRRSTLMVATHLYGSSALGANEDSNVTIDNNSGNGRSPKMGFVGRTSAIVTNSGSSPTSSSRKSVNNDGLTVSTTATADDAGLRNGVAGLTTQSGSKSPHSPSTPPLSMSPTSQQNVVQSYQRTIESMQHELTILNMKLSQKDGELARAYNQLNTCLQEVESVKSSVEAEKNRVRQEVESRYKGEIALLKEALAKRTAATTPVKQQQQQPDRDCLTPSTHSSSNNSTPRSDILDMTDSAREGNNASSVAAALGGGQSLTGDYLQNQGGGALGPPPSSQAHSFALSSARSSDSAGSRDSLQYSPNKTKMRRGHRKHAAADKDGEEPRSLTHVPSNYMSDDDEDHVHSTGTDDNAFDSARSIDILNTAADKVTSLNFSTFSSTSSSNADAEEKWQAEVARLQAAIDDRDSKVQMLVSTQSQMHITISTLTTKLTLSEGNVALLEAECRKRKERVSALENMLESASAIAASSSASPPPAAEPSPSPLSTSPRSSVGWLMSTVRGRTDSRSPKYSAENNGTSNSSNNADSSVHSTTSSGSQRRPSFSSTFTFNNAASNSSGDSYGHDTDKPSPVAVAEQEKRELVGVDASINEYLHQVETVFQIISSEVLPKYAELYCKHATDNHNASNSCHSNTSSRATPDIGSVAGVFADDDLRVGSLDGIDVSALQRSINSKLSTVSTLFASSSKSDAATFAQVLATIKEKIMVVGELASCLQRVCSFLRQKHADIQAEFQYPGPDDVEYKDMSQV
jgi:peptidoglycan hydrolase CwlO-like protein